MKAREIYHALKSIVRPIHVYNDQMVSIAKWIEAEFEYKPNSIRIGQIRNMKHELKILPKYFEEVLNGNKTFELRKDDRDYKVGDTLRLLEFDYGVYTGRECNGTISYILRDTDQYGLKEGFVILAMEP